jgi:hypothetical protein
LAEPVWFGFEISKPNGFFAPNGSVWFGYRE